MAENKTGWIQAMIEREATPLPERKDSVKEFTKKYGILPRKYNYQKNKPENRKKVTEIWLNEATNKGNQVLAKLAENALEGKEKSIEMYLKFVLQLAERMELTGTINISNILDELNEPKQETVIKQELEAKPPIQDKKQETTDSPVQSK